jgi:hypothetical protein
MFRQDYLLRLIEEFGHIIARVVQSMKDQRLDEAEREIATAEQALGIPPGLEQIDPVSAALVLGNSDKVVMAARLLELRAEASERRGRAADAARHRARAVRMLVCARPVELTQEAADLRARLMAPRS